MVDLINNVINAINVQFYVTPLVNACVRVGTEEEKAKIEEEIMEARRLKKEEEKKRKEKQKTVKGDKYVEEAIENKDEAEKVRQRLERARALDREKYGE